MFQIDLQMKNSHYLPQEFTEFHRKFYHPSNSYLYLYGDMDIESTLQFIDEEYLSSFKNFCNSSIKLF